VAERFKAPVLFNGSAGDVAPKLISRSDVSAGKTGALRCATVGSVAERLKAPVLKTGEG